MSRRVAPPFRLQREIARHGKLIERLIPAPTGVGDHARDQGVKIDFPISCDASGVAGVFGG